MIFVQALGTAQIDLGDTRVVPTSPRKFALLLYLAAERGRRVPRTALQDLIFPDQSQKNGQHSLRELVYQLRQAAVRLESDSNGVELVMNDVHTDFDALIRGDRPTVDQLRAVEGGFLPGYAPEYSETLAEWLAAYRARTTFDVCKAILKEVARARNVGDWMMTERAARACLVLNPVNEEATFALAEMLAIGGAKTQAVELLDRYAEEVGHARRDLHLPVSLVRRRISERIKDRYQSPFTLPFVGRDSEMTALSERFDRARDGESQGVVLAGDPGIGKSRLAEEFCTRVALDGARVEMVVTQPHDTHRPMGTVADLVPGLLRLPGALGCSPASMAALKRLINNDRNEETSTHPQAQSEAVASAIARAIADLVDAIANESPLVLLVDDAQWADELSIRTFVTLISTRQQRRLMIILASRERSLIQRLAQTAMRALWLPIAPLAQGSLSELLDRVWNGRDEAIDQEFRSWLAHCSGGNPFFLRCLVAHFQSTGERFVVPTSVSSLLDQQLLSLTPDAATVLGTCVALGRHSEIDRLLAALELPHMRLQLSIRELETAHLVIQQDRRIEPAHWLVAEAVNRSTSPIAARLLHGRVALILEREADTLSPASVWDCAEHWLLAGETTRATTLMSRCAQRSIEIGRPREAVETLFRAATLLKSSEQAALISRAIEVADATGETDLVLRGARYAHTHDLPIQYDGFEVAEILARIGEWDDAAQTKEELRTWLTADKASHLRLKAGMVSLIFADFDLDPAFAHEAYAALEDDLERCWSNNIYDVLKFQLIYHSRFGDIEESLRVAYRLLELTKNLDPAEAADIQRKAAVALLGGGELSQAVVAMHTAYDNAHASGLLRLRCSIAHLLATMYEDLCDEQSTLEWLNKVEQLADDIPGYRTSISYITLFAEMAVFRHDAVTARHLLDVGKRHLIETPTSRVHRWLRALEMRVRQIEGEPLDADHVVCEMIGHHVQNGEMGDISDLEMTIALLALSHSGRLAEAKETLDRYVTCFRRSPGSLRKCLRHAARLIGCHHGETSPRKATVAFPTRFPS